MPHISMSILRTAGRSRVSSSFAPTISANDDTASRLALGSTARDFSRSQQVSFQGRSQYPDGYNRRFEQDLFDGRSEIEDSTLGVKELVGWFVECFDTQDSRRSSWIERTRNYLCAHHMYPCILPCFELFDGRLVQ